MIFSWNLTLSTFCFLFFNIFALLIDTVFDKLFEDHIPVGEVYTCLGLTDKGEHGIEEGARALLELVINN